MPGPVPKRSDQRRRRNVSDGPQTITAASGTPETTDLTWPAPQGHWHPIAVAWYESLQTSGQSAFYEASDIATAVYVAEAMTRSLTGERMSGQMFASVMSAMDTLLTTEGARRRARVELEKPEAPDTTFADQLEAYREAAAARAAQG